MSQKQLTDESDISLNGSLPLHQQILDLLFDRNPVENFSSLVNGLNTFVPNNKLEKVLLLGLLKRSVIIFGSHDYPLNLTRYINVDELVTLSSELIISLVKFNQHDLLVQLLKSIINYCNYNSKCILQFALLLQTLGQHILALQYLSLVSDMVQVSYFHFLIIHNYYEHLNDFDSGIDWCHKILKMENMLSNSIMKSKCHMYLAIGYYQKYLTKKDMNLRNWGSVSENKNVQEGEESENILMHSEYEEHFHIKPHDIVLSDSVIGLASSTLNNNKNSQSSLLDQSLTHLNKALLYDKHNHVLYYYLALISAQNGNINQAVLNVKQSLEQQPEYLPSLHLLVLFESCSNMYLAETLLQSTISEYPDSIELYITQAHILIKQENFIKALETMKEALFVWGKIYCDKKSDLKFVFNDNDSGQFSVDYQDKLDVYTFLGRTNETMCYTNLNEEEGVNWKMVTDTQSNIIPFKPAASKHVTFAPLTPCNENITPGIKEGDIEYSEPEGPGDVIDTFFDYFIKELFIAKICYKEIPRKLSQLIDIWGMFAQLYVHMKCPHDFVQCLRELLLICDCTASYASTIVSSTDQIPVLVLSKHCIEILFNLGLYFKTKSDLVKAKFCFDNVLNMSHNHSESLFHRGSIEKDLGHLSQALHTVEICLQQNDLGIWKGRVYALMGEIYVGMGEYERSSICYEVALQLNDNLPVCSYDIIPIVWE